MATNSTAPFISVVLCTYNPRADYLQRVIEGLKAQTLPRERWEFVVVDNNSQPPLALRDDCEKDNFDISKDTGDSGDNVKISKSQIQPVQLDLSWHPHARMVVETQQGLSHARRRGFEEANGELIVNLDDDVVLDPAYLETCLRLSVQYPFIGVFGCQREAEFEAEPTWPRDHYYGAERICKEDTWSNDREHIPSTPWGAGSVVTKKVAEAYTKKMLTDPRWARLGRTADKLLSCEDVEIAMTACDLGLGKGVFRDLNIKHLIQKTKMTEEFLCKNAYGNGFSYTFHNWLRFGRIPPKPSLLGRINRSYRLFRMSPRMRRQETVKDRGIRDAVRYIKNLKLD